MTDPGTRQVLITGPIHTSGRTGRYAHAAQAAGWDAIDWPVLRVRDHGTDPAFGLEHIPDLIAVTSASAVPALGRARAVLGGVPCAAVGPSTASALRAAGFEVSIEGTGGAEALAAEILTRHEAGALVLWPRGERAEDLAAPISAAGIEVAERVVYTVEACEPGGALPRADAVFFASPSAVEAFGARANPNADLPAFAIAIGTTTAGAISRADHERVLVLEQPTPDCLRAVLSSLEPRT